MHKQIGIWIQKRTTGSILVLTLIMGMWGALMPISPAVGASPKAAKATSQAKSKLDTLYEAAKVEGKVVFWGSMDQEDVAPLVKKFNEFYPGIAVEHFELQPRDIPVRVIAEAQAGRHNVDVAAGSKTRFLSLQTRGLTGTYDWNGTFKWWDPSYIAYNGGYLMLYDDSYPFSYNTKLVRPADLPRKWDDLLNTKWREKICVEQNGLGFAAYGLEYGEDRLTNYANKLLTQRPMLAKGMASVASRVAGGDAFIGMGNIERAILKLRDKGAPIDFYYPEVSAVSATGGLYLFKNAPHPNAARLWIGFLGSPESRYILETVAYRSLVRAGSGTKSSALVGKKIIMLDTEELDLKKDTMHKKVSEILLGVVK